ncbi:ACT domain-containing protein [Knoellia sp. CPCC 206453]|uniref:ACT domain-containing protein n=1 Tax=Knoellia pratensis TaxID=3404796 RepID=UPI003615CDDA
MDSPRSAVKDSLVCVECGQLPHPRRVRLALAKLLAVFPLEVALHGAVLAAHPPFIVSVLTVALSTTVLVIWVVEPSAMHLLTKWLHAPALRDRTSLHAAESLWRVRVTLRDEPGALERVTRELADLGVSILTLHVHPLEDAVVDEFVVGAGAHVGHAELVTAVRHGGGSEVRVWSTTVMSLVDGQTRALDLAAKVSQRPDTLPAVVAELLGAHVVTDTILQGKRSDDSEGAGNDTALRLPSASTGLIALARPDSPFTPAERARAARLAQIAEASTLRPHHQGRAGAPLPGPARGDDLKA